MPPQVAAGAAARGGCGIRVERAVRCAAGAPPAPRCAAAPPPRPLSSQLPPPPPSPRRSRRRALCGGACATVPEPHAPTQPAPPHAAPPLARRAALAAALAALALQPAGAARAEDPEEVIISMGGARSFSPRRAAARARAVRAARLPPRAQPARVSAPALTRASHARAVWPRRGTLRLAPRDTLTLAGDRGGLFFDPDRVRLKRGKPYRLVLTNPSKIYHNWVATVRAAQRWLRPAAVRVQGRLLMRVLPRRALRCAAAQDFLLHGAYWVLTRIGDAGETEWCARARRSGELASARHRR
jgi:hypothetical protein